MLVILIAGMVAELVMLPSILFGPMGRAFDDKKKVSEPLTTQLRERLPDGGLRVDNGAAAHDRLHAAHEHETHARR
jgi:hypothetical protein